MEIKTQIQDGGNLTVNANSAEILRFNSVDSASNLWSIKSDPVKNIVKDRGTERVFLKPMTPGAEPVECYIKRYQPDRKLSKIKAMLAFRPYLGGGAKHEWEATVGFLENNLPVSEPIALGKLGDGRSCILIKGITSYKRASEIFANFAKTDFRRKRALIGKIANLASKMHAAGLAHQDFYLVHIFIRDGDEICLIDLQRVIFQKPLSWRWRRKDLAQLLFSAHEYVTRTDILCFWKIYSSISCPGSYRDRHIARSIFRKFSMIKRHNR